MNFTHILEYPLPLAFLIYLTICTIILYTRPTFLFPNSKDSKDSEYSDNSNNEFNTNKNVWIFFIVLAVIIYALISLLVSHVNRSNYLALLSSPANAKN
jgi:hypothetical protein